MKKQEKNKKKSKSEKTLFQCKCGYLSCSTLEEYEKIKGNNCPMCHTKVKERNKFLSPIEKEETKKVKGLNSDTILKDNIHFLIPKYQKSVTYDNISSYSFFQYNGDIFFKIPASEKRKTTTAINIKTGERFRDRIIRTYKSFGMKQRITKEFLGNISVIPVLLVSNEEQK